MDIKALFSVLLAFIVLSTCSLTESEINAICAISESIKYFDADVDGFREGLGRGWNCSDAVNFCSWTPSPTLVGCNSEGHVTMIISQQNNIEGSLPSDIWQLTYLTALTISSKSANTDGLTGTIPNVPNGLSISSIDFSFNQLTGSIPYDFLNPTSPAFRCDLSNNQLTGPIPNSFSSNLLLLDLSGNDLSGEFPSQLATLAYLTYLDLRYNQLTGTIPSLNIPTAIYLANNEFTGNLPQTKNVIHLQLQNNQLSGTLDSLNLNGNGSKCQELNLAFNDLTGTVPSFLSVTPLSILILNDNQLSGELPNPLFKSAPVIFYLQDNNIVGCYPSGAALSVTNCNMSGIQFSCGCQPPSQCQTTEDCLFYDNSALIIGLSVGLGVPLLIFVIVLVVIVVKNKRQDDEPHYVGYEGK